MISTILTVIMTCALVVIFIVMLGVFALFDPDFNPDKR
jgi:hypothetical protein